MISLHWFVRMQWRKQYYSHLKKNREIKFYYDSLVNESISQNSHEDARMCESDYRMNHFLRKDESKLFSVSLEFLSSWKSCFSF